MQLICVLCLRPARPKKVKLAYLVSRRALNARDSCAKGRGANRLAAPDHIERAILPALLKSACPSFGVDLKAGGGTIESDRFHLPLNELT